MCLLWEIKMNPTNKFLSERYEKYEIEDELSSKIKALKRENKQLKKEVKRVKKQNDHFKSSKAYKLWKFYSNLDNQKDGTKSKTKNLKDIKVALISDQFTYDSFKYEFNIVSLDPKKWKKQFASEKPDIFFCESAWEGHNFKGTAAPWKDLIMKYYDSEKDNRKILLDILDYCRKNNIPTVFWNKEDPVHYKTERYSFAETAKEFDYIFTSAAECVERYEKDFNHPNVHVLMFAGQPKMFNPLNLSDETIDEVVFAGSYYRFHPHRTKLMDYIFDKLIENGQDLLIYDGQYYFDRNDYPERYQKYTVPTVKFKEIPNIYKKMKWGLNFNIVVDSQSMFARRVFELSLSYVNIITNYSPGIEKIFADNVFVFDKGGDLPDFNEDYDEKRLNNLYNVLQNHTYTARWKQILDTIGFEYRESKRDISIIFKLQDIEELEGIITQFNSIDYDEKLLKIIIGDDCDVDVDEIMAKYPVIYSMSFKKDKLKIKTQYFILIDGNVDSSFIKKAILHYQYLNKRVSICEGDDKFKLGIENTIENKIISKVNRKYLNTSDSEIVVYYI